MVFRPYTKDLECESLGGWGMFPGFGFFKGLAASKAAVGRTQVPVAGTVSSRHSSRMACRSCKR